MMAFLSTGRRAFTVLVLMLVLYCALSSAIPTSNSQPAFLKQLIKQISNSKKSLDAAGSDLEYRDDEINGYGYPGRMNYFIPMNAY